VTTRTVLHNMVVGIVLIFLVQWLFLGNLRSATIVAMTIPFALSFAVIVMVVRGESANLLSVGAIDFGLVVDATVIMMENIFRQLARPLSQRFARSAIIHSVRMPEGLHGKSLVIANSAVQVNRAIFFSAAIIIAGFVPLFTLSGIEGHIFGPMARTYAYALAGGLIATFTATPALSSILLPDPVRETETLVVRLLHRVYRPVLHFALANKIITVGGTVLMVSLTVIMLRSLGGGIPAQAGGGEPLDPRHHARGGVARSQRRLCQRNARGHSEFSGGGDCRLPARPSG
jgi:cobalt-zinc-cadmium resistance protein CzcA